MRLKVFAIIIVLLALAMSRSQLSFFNINAAFNKKTLLRTRVHNSTLKKQTREKTPPKGSYLVETAHNELAAKIAELLKKAERLGFHGNVLVAHKNHTLFKGATGYSNPISGIKANLNDYYQLASVSKQFTAISILQLVDSNLIHLDDPIKVYLPELPYQKVTIRHLLNHTSGMQNYMWVLENYWPPSKLPKNEDVISLLARFKLPLNYYPGRTFEYTNTNYVLLASIVERVSGKPFNTYLKERVFKPIGMTSFTFIDDEHAKALAGYDLSGKKYKKIGTYVNDGALGDKGVFASLSDLLKWDMALNKHLLVSPGLLKEAFTPGKTNNGKTFEYGLGFRLKMLGESQIVYHNGLWNGFRTSIIKNMDNETTIIILNNTNCPAKYWLSDEMERLMNKNISLTNIVNKMQLSTKANVNIEQC